MIIDKVIEPLAQIAVLKEIRKVLIDPVLQKVENSVGKKKRKKISSQIISSMDVVVVVVVSVGVGVCVCACVCMRVRGQFVCTKALPR